MRLIPWAESPAPGTSQPLAGQASSRSSQRRARLRPCLERLEQRALCFNAELDDDPERLVDGTVELYADYNDIAHINYI